VSLGIPANFRQLYEEIQDRLKSEPHIPLDGKVIYDIDDVEPVSFSEFLFRQGWYNNLYIGVPIDGTVVTKKVRLVPSDPETAFTVLLGDHTVPVNQVIMTVDLTVSPTVFEKGAVQKYTKETDDGEEIVDIIQFRNMGDSLGGLSLEIIGIPENGGRRIGMSLIENNQNDKIDEKV
jgi:hypothetical protein